MTAHAFSLDSLEIVDRTGTLLLNIGPLVLRSGEVLCVIGETGSGKSLLAQAAMGLLPGELDARGTFRFAGGRTVDAGDRAGLRALWDRETCIVPQEPAAALDPLARIARQLVVPASGSGIADQLARVDLPAAAGGLYPFEISGGMAQRVLIANAAASPAGLVIADEPTKGLDTDRIGRVTGLLRQLNDEGKTLLVITHDLTVVRALAGRVAIMKDGEIVETGATDEVLTRPRHPYSRAWLAADPRNWPACPTCLASNDVMLAAHGLSAGHDPARPLFRDLDLHVHRGEVLAVTGPSGVGKSTLGNVLLGLFPPLHGEVSWRGCDILRDRRGLRRLRRRFQKLHQDPATVFAPHRSVGAQLRDVMALSAGRPDMEALRPVLERLRLAPALLRRRIGEVSGGEAQRLALARLLMLDPWLIVADEPTSRLDPIVQRETMMLLRDCVAERGLSLVLVSHNAEMVRAVADTVLHLDGTAGGRQEPVAAGRQPWPVAAPLEAIG
ncbi:ABC transporter ATP-binding protein [Stappia sp.]|uniref:ABC transporter ATP-binding protein n=1 Tax=Stappia sp. TaxID=1870903 RepID=UPI003A9964F1